MVRRQPTAAMAKSGFVGMEPEILIPLHAAKQLKLHEVMRAEAQDEVKGDGRGELIRHSGAVEVYILTDKRNRCCNLVEKTHSNIIFETRRSAFQSIKRLEPIPPLLSPDSGRSSRMKGT